MEPTASGMNDTPVHGTFRVTLGQGPHQWTFACTADSTLPLVRRILELARDPDCALDAPTAGAAIDQLARATRAVLHQASSQTADGWGGEDVNGAPR